MGAWLYCKGRKQLIKLECQSEITVEWIKDPKQYINMNNGMNYLRKLTRHISSYGSMYYNRNAFLIQQV